MDNNAKQALSAIRRILRSSELQARALMSQTGLTPSQLLLLQQLEDGSERTAGDLAARMGIAQATATVMIQRLEARDLLRRRQGSTDRRQTWLSLSERGHEAVHVAPNGLQMKFADKFTLLRDWEQAMIAATLMRVADMLDAEPDAAPILDSTPNLTGPHLTAAIPTTKPPGTGS